MADLFYVRKRGRVTGPFELDNLLKLKDQGRITRVHELSTDRKEWKPAFEVDEVFQTFVEMTDNDPAYAAEREPAVASEPTTSPPSSGVDWYYVYEGDRLGPVSEKALATLVSQGDINENTLVWSSGLPDWAPTANLPQFAGHFNTQAPYTVPTVNAPVINTAPPTRPLSAPTANAGAMIFCRGCGTQIHQTAISCPSCGAAQVGAYGRRSRGIYLILALFLGGLFGVHNFYAGRITEGVIQLLIIIFLGWIGIGIIINLIWVLIECVTVTKDGHGQPMS